MDKSSQAAVVNGVVSLYRTCCDLGASAIVVADFCVLAPSGSLWSVPPGFARACSTCMNDECMHSRCGFRVGAFRLVAGELNSLWFLPERFYACPAGGVL